ncbi:hypothetical protein FCN77_01175 [Arthrobacter sp. 24S4-2]|uniref:hypothetical protein n=1 Tax=Arthrobacter sp. 24S4-2 TaxID=2575374 RepID=UPI0010C77163|nr:hypothetical protein [Arthrobacter sp. 24S4-2]QCO96583.1 hypothetical protein FCN77_01175 [Arthrobacter sp. 24S4-2]
MPCASSSLFRCPVFDGAADPTVIHRRGTAEWWMFYTARRATLTTGGVDWITGTRIGIAVSTDAGASWQYRGVVEGLDPEVAPSLNTHWAPEVVWHDGSYHMFLTWGAGAPGTWAEQTERRLVHFTSTDLEHWEFEARVDVGSENVIDAAFAVVADGRPDCGSRTRWTVPPRGRRSGKNRPSGKKRAAAAAAPPSDAPDARLRVATGMPRGR